MTLWSTYWSARGTRTLSSPIRSNCRQAIVPVASCNSVWSILSPTSSPGSSGPLTMSSLSILRTRFSAIAHHPRETSSVPPHSTQLPFRDSLEGLSENLLAARDALVDRTVFADGLSEFLRGLLARAPFREPADACDDVGADTPGLPVVVGDVGVHDGEAALGLLVALGRIGDEVALLQDLHDGSVGQLDGPPWIVHEDPLDLAPPLLVAHTALLRERLHLPLDLPAALSELPLSLLLGAPFLRGPVVLAPELLPRPLPLLLAPLRAPAPGGEEEREQQDHDHRNHDDDYQGRSIHPSSRSAA